MQEEQHPRLSSETMTGGHSTQWLGLMILQVFINLNNSVIVGH